MSEELQHLMERIKTEAIDRAEARAAEIIAQAEGRAAQRLKEAGNEADALRAQAEEEAERFRQRAVRSIEQAARDLLITLRQDIEALLDRVVRQEVRQTLDGPGLGALLERAVTAYIEQGGASADLQVLLGQAEREALSALFREKFAGQLRDGATLGGDDAILRGFRISRGQDSAYYEFSDEALSEALARFLRPALATLLQEKPAP